MSDSRSYTSRLRPEHETALTVVEGAAAQLKRAYADRAEAMREAARAGVSLGNIARAAGLTRERVRQILAGLLDQADSDRHAGVTEPATTPRVGALDPKAAEQLERQGFVRVAEGPGLCGIWTKP
jgi:hypothetical protein